MNAFALPSRFVHPPVVQLLNGSSGGKIYRLAEPVDYVTSVLPYPLIHIPAGFESDGASVPRLFWPWFPPSGPYTGAAIVHDWLCVERTCTPMEAHAIFDEAMRDLRVPSWQRRPMALAVRWFGPRW